MKKLNKILLYAASVILSTAFIGSNIPLTVASVASGTLAVQGPVPSPSDLALNKPATQSSTFCQNANTCFPAGLAVDGNTNGSFNGGHSCSATNYGYQNWWQVDLGSSQAIGTIQVWPRTDCCPEHLSNFYVLVSDQAFVSTDLATTLSQAGVSNYFTTGFSGVPTTILVNRTGRYVRVQRSDSQYLVLAEVQVWSPTDLALNKPVTQSSLFCQTPTTCFPPELAVDGNTNGSFNGGHSCSATNYGYQNWWQVDLGSSQGIGTIEVWPRTDCCPEHLSNFYVLVSDQAFVSTDLATTLSQAGVSNYYTTGFSGAPTTIVVNRTGRYVRVQRNDSQYLVISEVQVWNGPPPPSSIGQWSAVMDWTAIPGQAVNQKPVAVHASVIPPDGKVLIWSRDGDGNGSDLIGKTPGARIWDPAANVFTLVPNDHTLLFCSGHAFLGDGRLLVAGGHHGQNNWGEPQTNIFTPGGTWSNGPDMGPDYTYGRWYPTVVTLGNGDALVYSGTYCEAIDEHNLCTSAPVNPYPQVWRNATSSWSPRLNTMPDGSVQLYPWMHLAPNGQVFISGPDSYTHFFDPNGNGGAGAWTASVRYNLCQNCLRSYGSSVMYDNGKVLVVGGNDPPTATSETIDLTAASPVWRDTNNFMASARRQLNATLLADGKVLVTGGSSGFGFDDSTHPVFPAEIWDPATKIWSTMASLSVFRGYHSTAVLLPDGRVLSAGGGQFSQSPPASPSAEIYSPAYLFRGPRPTISSAPAGVVYGQLFLVGVPDAQNIKRVTWIRLSSTTHAFNMNQRLNKLSFTQNVDNNGLWITAPANGNVCPPGHYMLFILNGDGVPSVARIISIS